MPRAERQSAWMSKITNDGLTPHRMLYSCTHMATLGVKGLNISQHSGSHRAVPNDMTVWYMFTFSHWVASSHCNIMGICTW